MKKIILILAVVSILWSCKTATVLTTTTNSTKTEVKINQVKVDVDLVNIKNDKILVTITAPTITTNEITYHVPKTVPGTYSDDNYGKYVDDLKAYDNNGNLLLVKKTDDNSWSISNAQILKKITYLVNDTFDTEKGSGFGGSDIFSPTGSNIEAGKNVLLNTHCFIGYFTDKSNIPYQVTISHPATLLGTTSMIDSDFADTNDVFTTPRYAELVENPIMYSKPNFTNFNVNGMDITISVYSPNGKVTAENITPKMKEVMMAQKKFLGKFNATQKYSVIIYLSDMTRPDAKGFGALEHPTATTVVMPEMMEVNELAEQLKDIVSHEFFHIVTPLTIHSKEIQDFDYNAPKMSQHLWMYEGVTEYFANLFQINQGLITENDFYKRMADKIDRAKGLNDTMPFTTMSANVLVAPYKDQYLNVYEKGALIGMCIDIIIREKSNGERGILDLMQKLSNEYGVSRAFNDDELFDKITQLTYPEVGDFLKTYVSGPTPIPYDQYFAKVGVTKSTGKTPENVFLKGQVPYITVNQATKEISVLKDIELSKFMNSLGLKGDDIIKTINGKSYNLDNIYQMITTSTTWKDGEPITINIIRNGKGKTINGKVKLTYAPSDGLQATDASKVKLRQAWLKG